MDYVRIRVRIIGLGIMLGLGLGSGLGLGLGSSKKSCRLEESPSCLVIITSFCSNSDIRDKSHVYINFSRELFVTHYLNKKMLPKCAIHVYIRPDLVLYCTTHQKTRL